MKVDNLITKYKNISNLLMVWFTIVIICWLILKNGIEWTSVVLSIFILGILIILKPVIGLYISCIILPFNYLYKYEYSQLYYIKETLIVLLFIALLIRFKKYSNKIISNPLFMPILLFVILTFIQSFRNPNLEEGFYRCQMYIKNILFFFFGLLFIDNKKKLRILIIFICISFIIFSFFELQKFWNRWEILQEPEKAIHFGHSIGSEIGGSSVMNVNSLLLFICYLFGMVLYNRNKIINIILIIFISIGTFSLFITFTRTTYVSLLVAIIFTLVYVKGKKIKTILGIIFLAGFFSVPAFKERIFSITDFTGDRYMVYKNAITQIASEFIWIIGSGTGTQDLRAIERGISGAIFIDNYFLIILAEIGIAGSIILFIIFYKYLYIILRTFPHLDYSLEKGIVLGSMISWIAIWFSFLAGGSVIFSVPQGMFFFLLSGVSYTICKKYMSFNKMQESGTEKLS